MNYGLEQAVSTNLAFEFVAYLPSDDVYYADHLASLVACLEQHPKAILAYSGVRHHYDRTALGQIDGYTLQISHGRIKNKFQTFLFSRSAAE